MHMKRLFWLVIVLAACGGGDGGDRVDAFIGTWTYQPGSNSTLDCDNNQFDMMEPLTGSVQFSAGTSSDLIEVPGANDTCAPVRLDVSGGTANAQAGQMCTSTVGTAPNTLTVTVMLGMYTLALDSAGTTVTLQGRASVMFTGAATATCTSTAAGTATKTGARTAGEPGVTWIDSLVRRPVALRGVE
jgi:hypothetical protein